MKKIFCIILSCALVFAGCKENTANTGGVTNGDSLVNGDGAATSGNSDITVAANETDETTADSSAPDDTTAAPAVSNAALGGNLQDVSLAQGEKYVTITVKDYGTMSFKLFPELAPAGVENFLKNVESGYYNGKKFHRIMKDFMIQGGSKNGDGMGDPSAPSFGVELAYNARHFYGALCYANSGTPDSNQAQFYIVNKKAPGVSDVTKEYVDSFKTMYENLKKYKGLSKADREKSKDFSDEDKATLNSFDETQWANVISVYDGDIKYLNDTLANIDAINRRYGEKGGYPSLDGSYTVFGQITDGTDVLDKLSNVAVKSSATGESSVPESDIIIEKATVVIN